MLSRRVTIIPLAAAAAVRRSRRVSDTASQPSTAVDFRVPSGACDCHTHVFGDSSRFPFAAGRTYTPESASVDEMRKLHRALHTSRVVIVQPSVYGTDNRCTLDAIKQLGSNARGIAVIDEHTSDAALDEMDHAGIRGIRINLATVGQTDPDLGKRRFDAAVARIGKRKWHIQMYTQLSVIAAMAQQIPRRRCLSCSTISAARRRRQVSRSRDSTCCWICCGRGAATSKCRRRTADRQGT